ncbi:MAG: hypothetical protein C5B59_15830 [Bacteroidetes bacterium]|nr:MAG: hypothetical protein C5B59_15830 [Bacteroidota bacterium]
MAFNLIDSVKSLISPDLVGRAAGMLGESESGITRAVSGIVPSVFAGVLNKAGSGDAAGVLNMAKDAANTGILANLGGVLSGGGLLNKGAEMLRGLFGEKTANVTSAVSNFAGIKESSSSSLMSMLAPAALGVLGKHAIDNNMSSGGLLSFLNTQKDSILNSVPSGMNLAGALGLGSLASIGGKLSNALTGIKDTSAKVAHMAESGAERAAGGMRWLLPLLLIVLAIGLIWYFMRGCNASERASTMVDTAARAVDTAARSAVTPPARESVKVRLPDGTELNAYKGGVEEQLVAFLNDPNSRPGRNVWFDFDNVNFRTGSAEITPESQPQVRDVVLILKAFPRCKIKIGGYTDKTGDSAANLKLSQERADAVVAALRADGASASQVTGGEGYGSQFAKADANAPDEERMKDRRISVSVRDK